MFVEIVNGIVKENVMHKDWEKQKIKQITEAAL